MILLILINSHRVNLLILINSHKNKLHRTDRKIWRLRVINTRIPGGCEAKLVATEGYKARDRGRGIASEIGGSFVTAVGILEKLLKGAESSALRS